MKQQKHTTHFKQVYRYDAAAQKFLHSTVKPEPWLHCIYDIQGQPGHYGIRYTIFVWDTRKVVQTYPSNGKFFGPVKAEARLTKAVDSHEPLVGDSVVSLRR